MSEIGVTALAVSAGAQVKAKLRHPRRKVDERGRQLQFPDQQGRTIFEVFLVGFVVFMLLLALFGFTETGEMEGAIILSVVAFAYLGLFFIMHRIPKAWYYEDGYGFELLTPFLHEKVSISYSEITSWSIVTGARGARHLVLKTNNEKKAYISLAYYRPLILLSTLARMEKEGCFGSYRTKKEHNQAISLIDGEFCAHVDKVREEMRKTGATIYIPER